MTVNVWGLPAAAGNLHRPLARDRIAGHVLPGSPDLRQEVFAAVSVEHQVVDGGRRADIVRQCADDGRMLAVGSGDASGTLRGDSEDKVLTSRQGTVLDAEREGDVDLHELLARGSLGKEADGGEQQDDGDQGASAFHLSLSVSDGR